jgi:hypothetical protein
MSSSDNRDASAAERREAGRRASGSMAGLEAEERARIQRMTPVERMTLALRMGRIAPPDLGDPIDGLLRVRASPDGDPVDIVNFAGPGSAGALAIARAEHAADGFAYARVPELVALTLYAGSRFDLDDVARLLAEAEHPDMDEVRRVAEMFGLGGALDRALARIDR